MKIYEKMLNKIESHLENEDISIKDTVLVLRDKASNKWVNPIVNWYTKLWFDENFYEQAVMTGGATSDVETLSSFKSQFDLERPYLEEMSVEELMKEMESHIEMI